MERIKIFQVDAFTNNLFSGNPAAVCLLDNWLPDEVMQSIALENNLSETAYLIKKKGKSNFANHILFVTGNTERSISTDSWLKKLSDDPNVFVDLCHVKSDLIKNSIS